MKQLKRIMKFAYYYLLCLFLNPGSRGLDPYRKSPVKLWLTRLLPGNKIAAVRLLITGKVTGVGFGTWLRRQTWSHQVDSLAIIRNKGTVEALLIGKAEDLETLTRLAWKGPKKARVARVKERWFNKPRRDESKKTGEMPGRELRWSKETAQCLRLTLEKLAPLMKKPNRFTETGVFSNAGELQRAAVNHNLFAAHFPNINYLVSPVKHLGLQQSQSSRVNSITRSLTDHKHFTKEYLARHGLPVPRGSLCTDYASACDYLAACNFPLVVKPAAGSYGEGITVDVRTGDELRTAWDYARRYHEQVVLEELVAGVDIRVIIIGGKAFTALLRVPANVVGDGKKKVEHLVEEKNKMRLMNPRMCKALIIPDIYADYVLSRQGYSWESVPAEGEVVFLHQKANIGPGGDSINVMEHLHPDLLQLAVEAAAAFAVNDFWGIDLLVERIDLPRERQRCRIIEVNSRANIYNVQFPMYGKPVDAADALIKHLFPEDTKDEAYPLQSMGITLTGSFHAAFPEWIASLGRELQIRGRMDASRTFAEGFISVRQHKLLTFLNRLRVGEKESEKGIIDNLQVYPYNGDAPAGFEVIITNKEKWDKGPVPISHEGLPEEMFGMEPAPVNSYSPTNSDAVNDINIQLFLDEFARRGYEAKYLGDELLEIRKEGITGFTGMRHSSFFCDKVCTKIHPAKRILSLSGLPVLRGARFKSTQLREAKAYYRQLSRPCIVTILRGNTSEKQYVESENHLAAIWKGAKEKGITFLFMEEYPAGRHIIAGVVAEKPAGAAILNPVSLRGDGESTVEALIAKKNRERKQNPYYQNKPVLVDRHLREFLRSSGRQPDDVPAEGEQVPLESAAILELGGEITGFDEFLHMGFKEKAVQAVKSIPGLEFAFVHFIIPNPREHPDQQKWAVAGINPYPSAARLHFPWRGKPYNLVKKVVNNLCLTDRTRWIKREEYL